MVIEEVSQQEWGNSLKHDENVIFFILWGFYPLRLLSAGAFVPRGFYPLGLLSAGLLSNTQVSGLICDEHRYHIYLYFYKTSMVTTYINRPT